MIRQPVLLAVLGAALAGLLILLWPPVERDSVADGLLPEGQRPRLLNAAAPTLEASAASRMIAFAPPGAGPAPVDAAAGTAAAPAAPAPPPVDLTPLLVGVSGGNAAPVGYFSYRGQTYRARRGETIGGWKVVALTRLQATLVKGRKRLTTALFANRSGALSPPMASAAPGPTPTDGAQTPSQLPSQSANPGATPSASPAPPPGVRKRRVLPPLPAGSKGWWSGPRDQPVPPGYTRIPD